ncbi:hypothetical protein BJX61DRAFT_550929 [Aspergillus egyptiacus]|nr:hypothetical protein BJX61DRAFT_550929 [Aspergillus egyptiacus]
MATGVETAGLVLGSLPLLIAALEHYDGISRPTKDFFAWRKQRRRLIQELYTLRASYDQAISLLLKPIDPVETAAMINGPLNQLWASGPIADCLREILGTTYDPLRLTIAEIAEILSDIAAHLNLQKSQKVRYTTLLLYIWETDNLRGIVLGNPVVANAPFLRQNFDFRQRVVFTMRKRSIKASLERLELCTKRIDSWVGRADRLQDESVSSRSKVTFTGRLDIIQRNATRIYRALLRNCFDGDCCTLIQRFDTEFRVVGDSTSEGCSTANVRVQLSLVHGAGQAPYENPSKLPQIQTLCQYMQQPIHRFFGFCLDGSECLRVYPSNALQPADHYQSLEAILPSLQTRLPLEEVYCLAITLVASAFQLSHTPWLEPKWGKRDIAFMKASSGPHLPVDLRYPYLTRDFSNTSSKTSTNDSSSLLSLAILLLELSFGEPIEQIRHPDDLGNKTLADDMTDFQTANRWYKTEKARLSRGFQQAILTCLQEYLNPDADLNEPEYCKVIKDKVLLPLEDEMQYIVFGPPR